MTESISGLKLSINGLGRIGKLTLWHHVDRKFFKEIVVNTGRKAGTSLVEVAHYVERDSAYGWLHGYLYGHQARSMISKVDDQSGTMRVDRMKVTFLRDKRDPAEINRGAHSIRLVGDTTGKFFDPTLLANGSKGSLQGHLAAGTMKVVVSAPFKFKDKTAPVPADEVITVMGVNANDYDSRRHRIIPCASCTTKCLAHIMRPLIDAFGAKRILSASMATVHAATSSQEVLDHLLEVGKTDMRKSRSIMNNIILTTTGAANALRLVIPEMKGIPFTAESVRIPTSMGSLIILVVNLQEEPPGERTDRTRVNAIYRQAAGDSQDGYLEYTGQQSVSADIIGMPRAAAIIEGHETHRYTTKVPKRSMRRRFATKEKAGRIIDIIEALIGLALFAAKCQGIIDIEWPAVAYAWALIAGVAKLLKRWWSVFP